MSIVGNPCHVQSSAERELDASDVSGASASKTLSAGGSASDDANWFAEMVQALLGKPGLELHLITGFNEGTCYRYAAGRIKPPAYFLRAILRSEQGGPFLEYLMQGSTAAWWRDLKAARDLAAQFKIERRQLT